MLFLVSSTASLIRKIGIEFVRTDDRFILFLYGRCCDRIGTSLLDSWWIECLWNELAKEWVGFVDLVIQPGQTMGP